MKIVVGLLLLGLGFSVFAASLFVLFNPMIIVGTLLFGVALIILTGGAILIGIGLYQKYW